MSATPPEAAANPITWLLWPLAPAAFYESYYEQRVCHVARQDAAYYQQLLSMADIDRLINERAVTPRSVRLAKMDSAVQNHPRFTAGNAIDPAKIFACFAEGWTIILSHLDDHLPRLERLCQQLMIAFSSRFQTNVYVTPGNEAGFRTHYDTHDVFVLQVAGAKKWRIYRERTVERPLRSQPYDASAVEDFGEVETELTLNTGDMLYIPRGVLHDASSIREPSLHITTGMMAYTWADLLLEAVARQVMNDPEMRRHLPLGFAQPGARAAEAAETLDRHLHALLERTDIDAALGPFREELVAHQKRLLHGQLKQLGGLDQIDARSEIEPRVGQLVSLSRRDEGVIVHIWDKEILFPAHTEPAVRAALMGRTTVAALPDCIDEQGKIVLVRRLVKEGLLQRITNSDASRDP